MQKIGSVLSQGILSAPSFKKAPSREQHAKQFRGNASGIKSVTSGLKTSEVKAGKNLAFPNAP
jgi:hypothetical protein